MANFMEAIFGKKPMQSPQQQQQYMVNGPQNPNVNNNPNDPSLTAQQRNQALQNQQNGQNNQNQQPGQSNTPMVGSAGAMNNQAPGGNVQPNSQQQQPSSPLDDFNTLWETPTPEQRSKQPKKFVYPKFDPNKVSERVNQLNFAGSIPDDVLSKAAGGDLAAFRDVLNTVGRQAFSTGFSANNNLNSEMFNQFDQSISQRIPAQMKGIQNQAAVYSEMKNLNHPAVAPMLNKIVEQMQFMYPDATPEEISTNAKKYMVTMAQLITDNSNANSQQQDSQQQGQRGNAQQRNERTVTDFSNFDM